MSAALRQNKLFARTRLFFQRNISETGARRKFFIPSATTDILDLHIPLKGHILHAKVPWQNTDEIGIAFVTDATVEFRTRMMENILIG